jgi:hypothetical protein
MNKSIKYLLISLMALMCYVLMYITTRNFDKPIPELIEYNALLPHPKDTKFGDLRITANDKNQNQFTIAEYEYTGKVVGYVYADWYINLSTRLGNYYCPLYSFQYYIFLPAEYLVVFANERGKVYNNREELIIDKETDDDEVTSLLHDSLYCKIKGKPFKQERRL